MKLIIITPCGPILHYYGANLYLFKAYPSLIHLDFPLVWTNASILEDLDYSG